MSSFANLAALTKTLGRLAPTVEAALKMLDLGLRALTQADELAASAEDSPLGITHWLFGGVDAASPGEQRKRDEVRGHLEYYRQGGLEAGFYDVRDYTLRAFTLYNAAVQTAKDAERLGDQFFADALSELEALPLNVGAAIGSIGGSISAFTVGALVKGFLGTPFGLAVALGAGYLLYRNYLAPIVRRL